MKQCTTKQLIFSFFKRRKPTIDFAGGDITSDAGLLLKGAFSKTEIIIRGDAGLAVSELYKYCGNKIGTANVYFKVDKFYNSKMLFPLFSRIYHTDR